MRAIFWAGLIGGVLDITAACLNAARYGVGPQRVFQSVASGLLGQRAFEGGTGVEALGLSIHFLIAFTVAAVYYLASRQIQWLRTQPFLAGPLYGAAVHFVMTFAVLPLTAVRQTPFRWDAFLSQLAIHMVCVGLPIALVISRMTNGTRRRQQAG